MEFSNRTLAWLVLATIVVSLFGTMIALNRLGTITALATSNATGQAQVSLSSQTSLEFRVASIDLGTGSVNGSDPYQCNLSVNKTSGVYAATITKNGVCNGFSTTLSTGTLTIENTGNTVLNVTLNFSGNGSTIIGGGGGTIPDPDIFFTVAQNESTSCTTLNTTYMNAWTQVQPYNVYNVCWGLNYVDSTDSIAVGLKLSLPSDVTTTTKTLLVRAQGTG